MQYIDEKFKERKPEETVALIQSILAKHGIEVVEKWHDSGVENCYSLSLSANGGVPSSNGKGITKALARASAYGEFIERLQGGLFFYKFQSIGRDPALNIHTFAPDVKYMTVQELEENGEWMDHIIKEYNNPRITRKSIARLCKIYDVTSGDKILTLPFYSLFEKKTVYLPMAFVDQIYATNGCCVGNTRDEAWVHALSEMMERHASINMLLSGKAAPKFPEEILHKYSTVSKILTAVRENGDFDIDIFDYSEEHGYPVVSTRIINKKNHCYHVNVASDPVFEIALQRTLTEIFQGKNIRNFTSKNNGRILSNVGDYSNVANLINQLETGSGIFTADYFANELTCTAKPKEFSDNSNKSNRELLDYALSIYKKLDKPVYVRNFSYLGFSCYRFVVPGFSEAFAVRLAEIFPEYAIADDACKVMKDPIHASDDDISALLIYNKMISGVFSRYYNFGRISGLPLTGAVNNVLACVTRAYAAYRSGDFGDAVKFTLPLLSSEDEQISSYFSLVGRYIEFKQNGMDEEKIRCILRKFYTSDACTKLFAALDQGKTPYDDFLVECDFESCGSCKYSNVCSYHANKAMNLRVGAAYQTFTHGQDESEFAI